MTLFFRNATPMLELLLIRAAGTSSCSEDHVADNVRNESVHSQQSNGTSVNKKDISVSIESPINLCYIDKNIDKSMQILGEREARELKIKASTIRKDMPTETQGVLCGVFEDKEVAERMQRFRSPKRAIEYVLDGIKRYFKDLEILKKKSEGAYKEGLIFREKYVYKIYDFAYVLKRFADSDENIKEACKVFDAITECGLPMYYGNTLYAVKRSENDDENSKDPVFAFKRIIEGGESIDNDDDLGRISCLLNKALENCKKKNIARDNIQTSDSNLLNFIAESLKQHLDGKRDIPFDEAKHLFDIIRKQNTKDGAEFFDLKSFDNVIQYISDYVQSVLAAGRSLTRDESNYVLDIIDKLKTDNRIKFFKGKSLWFENLSKYAAESDEPSEEYLHSEYVRYDMAKFVDEMLICCQKHFYYSFLTKMFQFPDQCRFSEWSDGIWDFRLNKFKRPLECHTAVIGRILKDKDAVFVDL